MAKRIEQDQLFTALILSLLTLVFAASHLLERVDYIFYDVGQAFSAKNPPKEIVIIAIDERSLDAIGKWPWRRSVHAELLEILQNAKPNAVGMDIFFSEADEKNPQDDIALTNALTKLKNVVLPIIIESPYQGARLTEIRNFHALAHLPVGRVNVPLDSDGIARGIYLWEGISSQGQPAAALPHFAAAVLDEARQLPENLATAPSLLPKETAAPLSQVVRQDEKKIRFYGPPGHFQHVSYSDVLSGEVPASFFAEKIVLIGATAVGMGDVLFTPVSGHAKPMAGVEFHANAIETINNHQLVSIAPLWVSTLFCVILALVPLFWLPIFSPLKSLLTITVYFVVVVLLTLLLPVVVKVWIPTSAALFSILLAYPIWSWRRLERAYTFLNLELQLLSEDLKHLGSEIIEKKKAYPDDLNQRISQVKRASELLRSLQKKRNETLSFISHDLRTPLATALMLLRGDDAASHKNKIVDMLARANQLADSFLKLSKAEAILPTQFKTLELNGLLQETADNLYEIARAKKMGIDLQIAEDALWVQGDFALLQRVFENLLNNAIQYGNENTRVVLSAAKNNQYAVVQIKNLGVGIAQDKIPHLFQKFTRLEESAKMTKGSGLGLYFVWLTSQKHGGSVEVESLPQQFTTFTVRLPLQV